MSGPSPDTLRKACDHLAGIDPTLARAYEETGVPVWRYRPPTYETLARTIVYQQISTAAAGKIWQRVLDYFGDLTAAQALDTHEADFRKLGLSRPKIRHLTSIASAVQSGPLDLQKIQTASRHEARAALLAVKGIGPWTAEIFCLYALGDMDAFPTNDVGLTESHRLLSGADERLDKERFSALGETWRPYRGVSAHLLWAWIGALRAGQKQS